MPQAFKGCLKAFDAAAAMAAAVKEVFPEAAAHVLPMADGGDDTLDVLMAAEAGRPYSALVQGPRGEPVKALWGVLGDGRTAVIEMAQASGIRLLAPEQRDPRVTSTYGTGQLIAAALEAGYRSLLVGVGGSATVDAGTGALTALGVRFLDANGRELAPGGASLARLARIDTAKLDQRARRATIRVACDVNMTLCGPRGSWRFAAQKGADESASHELEAALEHFARVVTEQLGIDLRFLPYGGPAGGLAGGLHAFLGASLEPGAELVLEAGGWGKLLPTADLVLIGEGMIDANTFRGKGPGKVASMAQRAGVPVIAIAGQIAQDAPELAAQGIVEVQTLLPYAASEADACAKAGELVHRATVDALRRWQSRDGAKGPHRARDPRQGEQR